MKDAKILDALIAEETMEWVWQPVHWMNKEQSVLVPYHDSLKENDSRLRLGDSVYKFVPEFSTVERLLALIILEMRAQKTPAHASPLDVSTEGASWAIERPSNG